MNRTNANEVIGGITTFFTLSYIVIVNPAILSTQGTGMAFSGVLTATVLLSFLMTLLMGIYGKLPFAVAPGMGINAFFTFTLILGKGIPWQTALGIVFWAGVLFLLISLTPIRLKIAGAIPHSLRLASAAGIGIFLTFIGLKNSGFVAADPVTFVKLGKIDAKLLLMLAGLLLAVFLFHKKNPLAFLISILSVTALGFIFKQAPLPQGEIFSMPDFQSVFFKLDIWGALKPALLPAIFAMVLTDLFDSISTFVGVSEATGLTEKNGQPKNLREGLIVDAWATLTAGIFGTSSGTAFVESAAGIESGARTGKASIVTALCFLPCFFIAPIASSVPAFATAPVLILVGALMFRSVLHLPLKNFEDLVPAFLTVVLIPLTFSITQGLLWGFISHVVLYAVAGRRKELSPALVALSAVSAVLLWVEHH
ncbi:MAG: NCS2 family permease [Bdellovibrionales bacterium]|nr:NCS2 family permease [Bdellovibrionales bacterium]